MNCNKSSNKFADMLPGRYIRRTAARPTGGRRRVGSLRGMSLLEVILAIAILAGTLAVLGEIVRSGSRGAQYARELADAQFVCSSMMAEITSGLVLPETTDGEYIDDNGQTWAYSVLVEPTSQEGLLAILVSVNQQVGSDGPRPITCSLARWMVDPDLEAELQAAADEAAAAAESSSSSSGESSSSSSTGGGSTPSGSTPSGGSGTPSGGSGTPSGGSGTPSGGSGTPSGGR